MKTALLLIPETHNQVDLQDYLSACIIRMHSEGYMALCPSVYRLYAEVNISEFIDKVLPICDAVYFFVDFGIDQTMFNIIDKLLNKIPFHYRRLRPADSLRSWMSPSQILKRVSDITGIPVEALKSKSRKRELCDARFCYFRKCVEMKSGSLASIGKVVNVDHASVMHGVKKALETKEIKELYDSIFNVKRREEVKVVPVEKPVLPYRLADQREHPDPVRVLPERSYCEPYHGYIPHQ